MAKGYKKYETKIIRPEEVRPGEKISGILELGESGFSVPATILCGKAPGKTVLITAGVHAGEYVGIQAVLDLAEELLPEQVSGRILLVKTVNRKDFENRLGSVSREDGKKPEPGIPRGSDGNRHGAPGSGGGETPSQRGGLLY